MKFKHLDFAPGKITYDGFDIDPAIPFEEQIYSLRQDLFQVSYGDQYTLDIGWLPDLDPKGNFIICVIIDYDWEAPIYRKQTNDLKQVDEFVKECAELVKNLLGENQ
jgi:hypothetical protein